jgi:hypothetical protein
MKRILCLSAAIAFCALGVRAVTLLDVENAAGPGRIKQIIATNNVLLSNTVVAIASTDATLRVLFTARTCAGATNGAYYTSRYVGDILINTTSNMVWIASTSGTTNAWTLLSN